MGHRGSFASILEKAAVSKKTSTSKKTKKTKKKTAKKSSSKATPSSKSTKKTAKKSTKKTSKKASSKTTKKSSSRTAKAPAKGSKTTKKPAATKKAATSSRPASSAKSKSAKSKATKSKGSGKATSKKSPARSAKPNTGSTKAPAGKGTADASRAKGSAPGTDGADAGSSGRQGMTVVNKRRPRADRPKPEAYRSGAGHSRIMGRKPLIPSGPTATSSQVDAEEVQARATKTPFNKRQLEKFRQILLQKRRELVGEVSDLEEGALRGSSGSLSHVSQHMADQGSEVADQSLSLDLAAAERRLIRDIDEALQRIENKTYGICEVTGQPIAIERLEELPWTRYSIVAAREIERRSMYE